MRTGGTTDVPTADAGGHVCWVFRDDDSLRQAAVAFLREGLTRNERLLYVADESSGAGLEEDLAGLGDLGSLVGSGTLTLLDVRSLYEPGGTFHVDRQVRTYRELTASAVAAGGSGLRVVADATALVATPEARRRFVRYETAVDRLMAEEPMTALCAYDERALGPAVRELCAVHPQRHARPAADPGFCLYHDRVGLRLAGELDVANHAVLAQALECALAGLRGDAVLDVAGVRFADARALTLLDQMGRRLRSQARSLRLIGAPPLLRRSWRALRFGGAVLDAGDGR